MTTPLKNYLDGLGDTSPLVTSQRLNLLTLEAALDAVPADPEVINELREGIMDSIAHLLNNDLQAADLAADQVAKSINLLVLKQ